MYRSNGYSQLPDNDECTKKCQRCAKQTAKYQAWNKTTNNAEILCVYCVVNDPVLQTLKIKRKTILDQLQPSELCERCELQPPKIRAVYPDDLVVEFLCRRCVDADPSMKGRSVRPKV